MKLKDLKSFAGQHCLQSCQSIATVVMESGLIWTGVYDSSNGHWLELPHLNEVGYLGNITVDGTPERAQWIKQFTGGGQ